MCANVWNKTDPVCRYCEDNYTKILNLSLCERRKTMSTLDKIRKGKTVTFNVDAPEDLDKDQLSVYMAGFSEAIRIVKEELNKEEN